MMKFISWDKLSIRYKVSLFVISTIAVSLLVYLALLDPQSKKIDELTAQYEMERLQVKAVEDFLLAHHPEAYLTELDAKIVQVDKMLPNNPEVSSFLADIEKLSTISGVKMVYFKPGKVENKEGYREYEIEILVDGNYLQKMDFLTKVEGNLRFTNVLNVDLQVKNEGLESKILAKIYSYGVPAVSKP